MQRRLLPLLLAYYGMLLLGGIWTSHLKDYRADLWTGLPLLVCPIGLVVGPALSKHQVERLLYVFSAGVGLGLAICLGVATSLLVENGTTEQFFYHPFAFPLGIHSIYLSLYTGASVVFLLYQLVYTRRLLGFKGWGLLLLLVVGLALLSSRMAIASTVVGVAVVLVYTLAKWLGWARAGLATAAVACLLVALVLLVPNVRSRFEVVLNADWSEASHATYGNAYDPRWHNDMVIRLLAWRLVWEQTEGTRLLGVGTGDTQAELRKGWRRIELDEHFLGVNAHNQYLQTFLATGFVGMAVLLATLLVPLVIALKRGAVLVVAYTVLVCLAFLTESYLIRQHGAMFHALFHGLLVLVWLPQPSFASDTAAAH